VNHQALKDDKRRLLQAYRRERRYFSIRLVTGRRVVFRFRGEDLDFTEQDGRITRGTLRGQFLTADDWAFLFSIAEELMHACQNGYTHARRTHRRTATKKETVNYLETLNPRQGNLF
jgi:hypothetical protein